MWSKSEKDFLIWLNAEYENIHDSNIWELINRQAAIDAAIDAADDWDGGYDRERERYIREALEELPSAQTKITECPMCPDCPDNCPLDIQREEEKAQLFKEDSTKGKTFDTIYRQVAIDVEGIDEQIRCEMCRNPMHTDRGCDGNCKYDEKLYEKIMQILGERIKPLPSVQPRNGKWIEDSPLVKKCSKCGYHDFDWRTKNYNFCPNCGFPMEEGDSE